MTHALKQQKPRTKLILFCLIATICILYSLDVGHFPLTLTQIISTLRGNGSLIQQQLLFEIRLPRILCAFITGGLLAIAGTLMQVLLRNPLADPYILGVSGGAAVGNLLSMLLGVVGLWQNAMAFLGALLAILLLVLLARTQEQWSPTKLLLTGVVLSAGWAALLSFILIIAPLPQLHGMLFWLMGDLSAAQSPWSEGFILSIGLIASLLMARELNLLTRGQLVAASLGVNTQRLQWQLYLLSSLLTACAVTVGGTIGFIGLIVPHLLRLLGCSDHRILLPGAMLLGGSLLCLADTFARDLLPYQQLPVGILTTLLGVPLFLILLHRENSA